MIRKMRRTGFLVLLVAFFGLAGLAQRNTGSIVGVITDSAGGFIPDVAITVTNMDTGVTRTEVGEKTGDYHVVLLPPGRYSVTATAPGFATEVRNGITLSVDQDARVDLSLKIGAVGQTVSVSSDAPLLNTENGELGTTLNREQVADLPSFERDILSTLPLLSPGVGTGGTNFDNVPPLRFSVNGGRALSQDMVVDGAEALSVNITSWNVYVPNQDAVQEMKFQTNAYDAENGRGTATINIITRSGTNQFHGSLYDFLRNEDFNANEYFNKQHGDPRPRVRDNLYGGTLGGPILPNKLFFFFQYEREPLTSPNLQLSSVPTAAFLKGDFSALLSQGIQIYDPDTTTANPGYNPSQPASATNPQYVRTPFPGNVIPTGRLDPVAVAAASYFPTPNTGGAAAYFNNEYNTTPTTQTIWHVNPRVDYSINERHQTFFRLNHDSNVTDFGGVWPGINPADNGRSTTYVPDWTAVLGDTYTFGPSLINYVRAGLERDSTTTVYPASNQNYANKIGLPNSNAENFPNFAFGAATAGYGLGPSNNLNQWEQTLQYSDTLTYLRGRHAFKFGGDVRFNQVNKLNGRGDPSGGFGFGGLYTSNLYPTGGVVSMADFLLGLPNSYVIQPATFKWGARKREGSWFVQDDWKVNPKITLNLGIRQDLQFSWHEVFNRYSEFSPTLINPANGLPGALIYGVTQTNGNKLWNFAPRLGFGWIPFANQKTVIRGGAGAFISPASTIEDYGDTGQGEETGYTAQAQASTKSELAPVFLLRNGGPPAVLPAQTPTLLNGGVPLYIDRGEATPYVYSWSLTMARELPRNTMVEASYVGTRATHLPFERSLNQVPDAKLAVVTNISVNEPYPQYLNVNGRFHDANSSYNSLQVKLEQRLSRNLDWTIAYTMAKSMDNSSLDPTTSWGGAQFSGSGVQDIYNLRENWARSAFDQRQKVGASFIYQLPFGHGQAFVTHGVAAVAAGGWQLNSVVQAHTGTPIEFQMSQDNSYSNTEIWRPNCTGNPFKAAHPTLVLFFNPGAFSTPAAATFGNCGRDLSAAPGYQEVDLSAFKNTSFRTPLNENTVLQFRAETYNTLNRANFGYPNSTYPTGYDLGKAGLGSFGQITSTVNNPRQMTLALKLIF